MKTPIFRILLFACFLLRPVAAQDAEENKLTARIILGQSTILPHEPASAMVSLGNETANTIERESYSQYTEGLFINYLGIAIYSEQNPALGWNTFSVSSIAGMPPPPGPIPRHTFAPGDTYYYFIWLGADHSKNRPFSWPSQYRIHSGGNFDLSPEKSLRVVEPQGADAEALKDLEAQQLYFCFTTESLFAGLYNGDDLTRYDDLLEKFARKHSRSRYADWARWGQILIRTQNQGWDWPVLRGISKNELAETQGYQREYERMAPQLYPFLRANAWYRAGILALLTGDEAKGESLLNRAVALNADATLPRRVNLVRQQIQKYPQLIYKTTLPLD